MDASVGKAEKNRMERDRTPHVALVSLMKLDNAASSLKDLPGGDYLLWDYNNHFEHFATYLSSLLLRAKAAMDSLPEKIHIFERHLLILNRFVIVFLKFSTSSKGRKEVQEVELDLKQLVLHAEEKVAQIISQLNHVTAGGIIRYDENDFPELKGKVSDFERMRGCVTEIFQRPKLCNLLKLTEEQRTEGDEGLKSLDTNFRLYVGDLANYMDGERADLRKRARDLQAASLDRGVADQLYNDAKKLLSKLEDAQKNFEVIQLPSMKLQSAKKDLNRLTEVRVDLEELLSKESGIFDFSWLWKNIFTPFDS